MGEVVSLDEYSASARAALASRSGRKAPIYFNRRELKLIFSLYGDMVANGVWRDYAIAQSDQACAFAVYQRSCDAPLYKIVKQPALARRQGAFTVVTREGRVLRRGHELDQVLRMFRPRRLKVIK